MNKYINKKSILSLALAIALGFTGCSDSKKPTNHIARIVDFDSPNFTVKDMAEVYIATYNKPPTYTIITDLMKLSSLRVAARSMNPNLALYPSGQSYSDFVETLYRTVYGRASTEVEKELWVKKLYNGDILKQDMWMEFEEDAKGEDRQVIDNKVAVSQYYADKGKGEDYNLIHIDASSSSVEAAKREIDLLKSEHELFPEPTHNLTTGEDHIYGTGGFDVIEGRVSAGNYQTLESIDGIDGGGGRDILRATIVSSAAPTIKNVEEVQIRFAGDDDEAVFDLINSTNIEVLNAMLSTQVGTVDNVYGINTFEVSSTQHNIKFDGGVADRIFLDTTSVGSPRKEVVLNFNKNKANYLKIKSISSYIKYDQEDGGNTLKSVGIDARGKNVIKLEAGRESLEKIVLSNNGDIDLAPGNGDAVNHFMFKALQKLEAESKVGDIKLYVDNSDEATLGFVQTAGGIDEVFIYSGGGPSGKEGKKLRDNLSINLGPGDDTLIIMASHANMIPSSVRIDGNGGVENKLAMNSDVATTLEDGKQEEGFDDFSVFIVIDDLDGTLDMNNIDDIQIVVLAKKYKDDAQIAGLEHGASITFTTDIDDDDGDTKIKITGDTIQDGTTDTYNLNFMSEADTDFGDITVDYIETLNFMTNDGGVKKAAIVAGTAKTINMTGNSILDIYEKPIRSVAKVSAGDAGIRVDISGDGGVKQTVNTGSGEDKIALGDGDGEHVNVCNVGRGNDIVIGGAGEDIVKLDSGDDVYRSSGGSDKVTFGTGRDVYIAQNAKDSSGSFIDKLQDFVSGEDMFDFRIVVKAANNDEEGGRYIGEADGYGAVLSSLSKEETGVEAVLDRDDFKLYIDVDDDADITDADMVIDLSANQVNNLEGYDFIFE